MGVTGILLSKVRTSREGHFYWQNTDIIPDQKASPLVIIRACGFRSLHIAPEPSDYITLSGRYLYRPITPDRPPSFSAVRKARAQSDSLQMR